MIFHPFELSFCGYSNSGKTTLISKLIALHSKDYNIGYIKHDAHKYQMDKEGKDTWQARKSGASIVSINDQVSRAMIADFDEKNIFKSQAYSGCDFVFVEGYKKYDLPKIILLNGDNRIFDDIEKPESVMALVYSDRGQVDLIPQSFNHLPTISRDELDRISAIVMNYFFQRFDRRNIKGLVLSGGKSVRMGTDKSALMYVDGIDQTKRLSDLLTPHCKEVFISCREDQKDLPHIKGLNPLCDRFVGFGPIGGILSAQLLDPSAYWLVLACDLPFVNEKSLGNLISQIDPFKSAVCYRNKHRREPLCTIYSPFSHSGLMQMLGLGFFCPQKYLWNSNSKEINLDNEKDLENSNTYNEFLKFKEEIQNEL